MPWGTGAAAHTANCRAQQQLLIDELVAGGVTAGTGGSDLPSDWTSWGEGRRRRGEVKG